MTPFPPSENVQFLLEGDSWITQIVFNATTMSFQFANECRVDVGGELSYVSPDGEHVDYRGEWFRAGPVLFHTLLEEPLTSIKTENLEMMLTFANGARLIVYSDLSPYEAGAVLGPENSRLGFYF